MKVDVSVAVFCVGVTRALARHQWVTLPYPHLRSLGVRAVGVQDHEGVLHVYSRTEPRYPSPRVQCEGLSEGSGVIPVTRPRFSSVGNCGSKEKEYAFNPKLHVRK